MMHGQKNIRI